jgi:flagellin
VGDHFWRKGVADMGLRISTNLPSIAAQRQIGLSQRRAEGSLKSLASGNRFDNPDESSAEHSIAEALRGQIRGLRAAENNANNAQSFINVGEGGLNEQNNILIRLRELAVQSASDTLSDVERGFVQQEYGELLLEIDRIAETTSFGSNKLLSGGGNTYEFQVGANKGAANVISYKASADTRASSLEIDGTSVDDKSNARDALESLDGAISTMGMARAGFGAISSRLDSTIANQGVQIENLSAAHSRIADTDVAKAASEMYRNQALQQYQISVLDQANRFPGSVIRLVG